MTNLSKIKRKTSGISYDNPASCNLLIEPWRRDNLEEIQGFTKAHLRWKIIKCNTQTLTNKLYCVVLLYWKALFKISSFYSSFKWAIHRRNVRWTWWHNAKRKRKSVQRHQLSIHLSIHPQNPVSHGLLEPSWCQTFISPLVRKMSCSPTISSSRLVPFQGAQCVCHVSCLT